MHKEDEKAKKWAEKGKKPARTGRFLAWIALAWFEEQLCSSDFLHFHISYFQCLQLEDRESLQRKNFIQINRSFLKFWL